MATVIFDFDSTIVSCEGLECLLSNKLDKDPQKQGVLHAVTRQGLDGEISFADSLKRRLQLAAPTKEEVVEHGSFLEGMVTPGMKELVARLHQLGVDVWIASGGIQETLYPVANALGIPSSQVLGVRLLWEDDGRLKGISPSCLFSQSKWQGLKPYADKWSRPVIMVGDSVSDYTLYEKGTVDDFILFTQNYRCEKLIDVAGYLAINTAELGEQIKRILDESSTL